MEEDYPKTLLGFEERFSTEASCVEYLRSCDPCDGRKALYVPIVGKKMRGVRIGGFSIAFSVEPKPRLPLVLSSIGPVNRCVFGFVQCGTLLVKNTEPMPLGCNER